MSHKRLYTRVVGGLGNQLFIYSAARRAAMQNNAELVLIADSYANEFHRRQFLLSHFNISATIEYGGDIVDQFRRNFRYRLSRHANRYLHILGYTLSPFIIERTKSVITVRRVREYDQRMLTFKFDQPCGYMEGYWQNEVYFKDIESTIKDDLTLKSPLSAKTLELAYEIKANESVCVHFRRTELEQEDMISIHGAGNDRYDKRSIGIDDYLKAVELLASRTSNLKYYCFSDYPDWMVENVKLPHNVTYVTHNSSGDACHEDLYLMRLCRYFIIPHSTFSWWGAWLSHHADKTVIVLKRPDVRPKSPYYPKEWTIFPKIARAP